MIVVILQEILASSAIHTYVLRHSSTSDGSLSTNSFLDVMNMPVENEQNRPGPNENSTSSRSSNVCELLQTPVTSNSKENYFYKGKNYFTSIGVHWETVPPLKLYRG